MYYTYKGRLTVSESLADGDNYHREKRHVSPKATHLARDGADADVGGGWWWLAGFKGGASTSNVEKDETNGRTNERGNEGTVANEGDRTSTRISMERHAVGFDLRIESLNWMYCAIERRAGMTPRDGPIKS